MMDYHRQNRVDIRIARIFNTFGPRMAINDGRVVSNFIVQALTGGEITIYGEGQQTRSFCLCLRPGGGAGAPDEPGAGVTSPMNLGNPEEFTIMELAQKILALIDSPLGLVHSRCRPTTRGGGARTFPGPGSYLDWQPTVPLTAGLEKTIPYFRTKLSQTNCHVVAGATA